MLRLCRSRLSGVLHLQRRYNALKLGERGPIGRGDDVLMTFKPLMNVEYVVYSAKVEPRRGDATPWNYMVADLE